MKVFMVCVRSLDLAGKTLLSGFLDPTATILIPYKTPELYALQRIPELRFQNAG